MIARLLVETNLPVAQIAGSLGFADVRHFARYFRTGKGKSPLAFRRAFGTPAAGGGREGKQRNAKGERREGAKKRVGILNAEARRRGERERG